MKLLEDIKVGDTLWIIDSSEMPVMIALPVINIIDEKIKKKIVFMAPTGNVVEIVHLISKLIRDFDEPFFNKFKGIIDDTEKPYLCSYDKKKLLNVYIDNLKESIKTTETVIEEGKRSLILLKEKLLNATKIAEQN